MDNIPQSEIDYQLAHIDDNFSTVIIGISSAFVGLAVVVFITRLIARRVSGAHLGWDDYFAIAAIIPLIELNIATCLSASFGVGRHLLWVLEYSDLVKLGKVQLGISVGYNFTMLFGKLSVLALYARIFTLRKRYMRWGIYSVGIITILWSLSATLGVFLICRPLSGIWGVPIQCLPPRSSSLAFGAVNFITDIVVLLLPQPAIWKLQRSTTEKIKISVIFLLGTFATVITLARLVLLGHSPTHRSPYDSTYSTTVTILFTVIEPAFVVLCGSLPMLPGLFRGMKLPTLRSNNSANSKTTSQGYLRWKTSRDGNERSIWVRPYDQRSYDSRSACNKGNRDRSESTEMVDLDALGGTYQTQPYQTRTHPGVTL